MSWIPERARRTTYPRYAACTGCQAVVTLWPDTHWRCYACGTYGDVPTDYPAVNELLREEAEIFYWAWLTGFIDGEASFMLDDKRGGKRRPMPVFGIGLTGDASSRRVLEEMQRALGVGRITAHPRPHRPREHDVVQFRVRGTACSSIVELLRRYPLMARSAAHFDVWATAVDAYCGRDDKTLAACVDRLASVRQESYQTS